MNYSKWATKDEMHKKTIPVNLKTGIEKSGLPVMYDDNYLYIDPSETHNLLIGCTGSGKTQAVIMPILKLAMKAKESIIINDPKGEIYKTTADQLKKEGYKVIALDFDDPRYGNSWNPLELSYKQYKEGNKDKALELIEDLGYYLLGDNQSKSTDPFWINSTINYFSGLVLYLFEEAKEDEINIQSVSSLANSLQKPEIYKKLLEKLDSNSPIYIKLVGILLAPTETKGSILSVFNQKIQRYLSKENLVNMLSNGDFDLSTFTKEPSVIFTVSGINQPYRNLVSLFTNQVMDAIEIYGDYKKRTNILLDEFDSLMPINNFASKLANCRYLNIRITVAIQSYAHLANMYQKEDVEILKMCFSNTIYLLSEDIYTLEEISSRCGTKLINGKEEPLISVSELKTLECFEAIVLMPRMLPFRTKLLPDYKIDWEYSTILAELPLRKTQQVKIYNI